MIRFSLKNQTLVLLRLEIEIAAPDPFTAIVLPREAGICVRTIQTLMLPLEFRRISGGAAPPALGTKNELESWSRRSTGRE